TAPGLAALFVPLTLAVGPVVAYNAASVLVTALTAWTAYLLCRYVTNATWPSLAGGYLFGFSSYELAQQGHPNLTSVFCLPLIALVVLQALDGRIGRRAFAIWLGLLIGAQLWFSTEVAATAVLALVLALGLAFWLAPDRRARLGTLLRPLLGAGAVAVTITSPLLYYLLTDFRGASLNPPAGYVSDLANFVVPTHLAEVGGSWSAGIAALFPGNEFEQDAYVGLPAIAILAIYLVPRRRQPGARFLAAAVGVAVIASFGEALHVAGRRIVVFPWWLVSHLPVLDNVLPTRLVVYSTLAAAVVAALWAAKSTAPRAVRAGLPALAALALFPNPTLSWWTRKPPLPQFFTAGYSSSCIRTGDNVVLIPWGYTGDSLLWQAVSGFHFRIAGGSLGGSGIASTFVGTIVSRLFNDHAHPGDGPALVAFARSKGASTIVVDPADPQPWSSLLLQAFGPPTKTIGGVLLYQVSPGLVEDVACVAR
ncbi:MAG TPA: hypothetical protein VFM96_09720, partial [Gaiellaceae bacterium]|nr:hypothetical protein [Gaiellaceae bacterium]